MCQLQPLAPCVVPRVSLQPPGFVRVNQPRPTVQVSGLSPSYVRHLWEVGVLGVLDREGLARDLNDIGLWMSTGAMSWPEAREQETKPETQPSRAGAPHSTAEGAGCRCSSVPLCAPDCQWRCWRHWHMGSKHQIRTSHRFCGGRKSHLRNWIVENQNHTPIHNQRSIQHYQRRKMVQKPWLERLECSCNIVMHRESSYWPLSASPCNVSKDSVLSG